LAKKMKRQPAEGRQEKKDDKKDKDKDKKRR
jgi:hypothetical protein